MDLQLHGKAAIVTGSSRGLGLASAKALAAEGCRVCLCARGAEALEQAAADLRAMATHVISVAADLSSPAGAEAVVSAAVEAFGSVDILVNNVGTARGTDIVNTADAEWQEALDHTLYPAIRMSRLVVPHMRKQGGGSIVMIASIWGRESGGRMTYNAVKAAEISLAKSMAQQLAKDNIRSEEHTSELQSPCSLHDALPIVAGGPRPHPVSRYPYVTPGRAPHAQAGRRLDCDDCLDLGKGVGRTHDLQRGQGGRDQPRQVDGPAAGQGQYQIGRAHV